MGFQRITDEEWEQIAVCFPDQERGRPRRWTDRDCLDGVFYVLYSGCRWNDLPREFPPCTTVYDRYSLWVKQRVFQKILKRVRSRFVPEQLFYLDSTVKPAKKGARRGSGCQGQGQQSEPRHYKSRQAVRA